MKSINITELKSGDHIFAFDFNLLTWIRCKVNQIEKYLITLEDLEGALKGFAFYETIDKLKNLDYYRQAG